MKLLIGVALILASLSGSLAASEVQMITDDEAYQMYLTLPGKACQEYRLQDYVVYTKYQTKSCLENQKDLSKWSCTVQFTLKNGKQTGVSSAGCSRTI